MQGKVEQVVFKTERTETVGAFLRILIGASLRGIADPGRVEALADFGVRKSDGRGFIEVIEDLRIEAVAVNRDRREETFVQ